MFSKILNTHHAILVEGGQAEALGLIKSSLAEVGLQVDGNPDIFFLSYEKFGIEDARSIIEVSFGAPLRDEKKIIIFSFDSITADAQNALLKIFEDPTPHLKFVLSTHTASGLLDTFRSRLIVCEGSRAEDNSYLEDASRFIAMSLGEKIKEGEKWQKLTKEGGGKSALRRFLLAVRQCLIEKKGKEGLQTLQALDQSLLYLDDKSASVKMLLDNVILNF